MSSSLFDRFVAPDNFHQAFQRVRKKKSLGGIDRISVDEFAAKLKQNLKRLRQQVEDGNYVPQPVQAVKKPKFNDKGEFRELGLPVVADKIVQAALLQVVEPLAERLFLDTSYAYRPGKGHRKALRRVEHNLNSGKQVWVVRQDVDNFFDTLDHDRLLTLFSDLVEGEERLVELVALWCRSGIVARNGRWRDVAAGVRQGQIISPLLANLYLHALDGLARDQGWGWVRYADDYLVQCREQEAAAEADRIIKKFLTSSLKLRLNRNDSPLSSLEKGFVFLGVFFRGEKRKIAKKKIEKMKRKLAWLLSPKNRASVDTIFADLEKTMQGWQRYYGFLGSGSQFIPLEQEMEKRLQALASRRIASGTWPVKPPAHLQLPLPSMDFANPQEARRRLQNLWKKARPVPDNKSAQQADRKNARRKREYRKKEVLESEMFVSSPGHFVGKKGNRIFVRHKQRIIAEIPGSHLRSLTLADHALAMSTDVVGYCTRHDIALHLIDRSGKIIAVLHRPDSERVELVQRQIALRDDSKGLELARAFIWGKVKNQLSVLKSYSKYKGHRDSAFGDSFLDMKPELERLIGKIRTIRTDNSPDDFRNTLMGLEGTFAARYWRLIGKVVPEEYGFEGRKRRGAVDLVNSLLNYGYGILYAHSLNAVTRAGLNAMAGFLHSYQYKKPVLTFDLVEEFRAPVVDKSIFSMLNRKEKLVQQKDHLLRQETCKKVAAAVLARLGTEVVYRGGRETLQDILFIQAKAIRRHLLDKGKYRPFLSRW